VKRIGPLALVCLATSVAWCGPRKVSLGQGKRWVVDVVASGDRACVLSYEGKDYRVQVVDRKAGKVTASFEVKSAREPFVFLSPDRLMYGHSVYSLPDGKELLTIERPRFNKLGRRGPHVYASSYDGTLVHYLREKQTWKHDLKAKGLKRVMPLRDGVLVQLAGGLHKYDHAGALVWKTPWPKGIAKRLKRGAQKVVDQALIKRKKATRVKLSSLLVDAGETDVAMVFLTASHMKRVRSTITTRSTELSVHFVDGLATKKAKIERKAIKLEGTDLGSLYRVSQSSNALVLARRGGKAVLFFGWRPSKKAKFELVPGEKPLLGLEVLGRETLAPRSSAELYVSGYVRSKKKLYDPLTDKAVADLGPGTQKVVGDRLLEWNGLGLRIRDLAKSAEVKGEFPAEVRTLLPPRGDAPRAAYLAVHRRGNKKKRFYVLALLDLHTGKSLELKRSVPGDPSWSLTKLWTDAQGSLVAARQHLGEGSWNNELFLAD
jgi:hypothetical protein